MRVGEVHHCMYVITRLSRLRWSSMSVLSLSMLSCCVGSRVVRTKFIDLILVNVETR
jgi:hypothetical protein